MRYNALTRALAGGSAAAMAVCLFSTPAFAQPVQPAEACQPGDTDENCPESLTDPQATTQASDQVVVVGTRIRRPNPYNQIDPISVIDTQAAVEAGYTSTAEILQSTAVTGGVAQVNNQYGGFVTDGGPGANTISLRGLGAARTLVVLNNRRISPAGTRGSILSSDLNVLPLAIVDRIEVLRNGASSIYGSDAIAGVINIQTRTNINGLIVDATHRFSEIGAGTERRYSAVAGMNTDRLNIVGSLEYTKRDAVQLGDLPYARCETQYRRNPAGAEPGFTFIDPRTGLPRCYPTSVGSGVTINTLGLPAVAGNTVFTAPGIPAGYTGTCDRFRPNPAVTTGRFPGYECVGGGTLNVNIRDTFEAESLQQDITNAADITTGFLAASYDIGILGNAEIYGEALATRRETRARDWFQMTIDYPTGSPSIPAFLVVPGTVSGAGGANGTPAVGGRTVGARVFAPRRNFGNFQQVDFVRLIAGIRGDLPIPGWRYDLYASRSWSDGTYTNDQLSISRMALASDVVVNPDGTRRCRATAAGLSNCVPLPLITPDVVRGRGAAFEAYRNWVEVQDTGTTEFRENIVNFSVDGPLFELPGGPASIALGLEYRSSTINDRPSEDSQAGLILNFSSSAPTVGSDAVREAFGEIQLPILANMPLAHLLEVRGSARYTDYDSYGADWTYNVGAQYYPVRWLGFRGSYGTSFRAPALSEQFLGATTGFQPSINDPCDEYGAFFDPTDFVYINCAAEGFAPTFRQLSSLTIVDIGGAAAGLEAETSRSWTVGAILQPDFGSLGRLSLAVDYFDVEVNNGVGQYGFGAIVNGCYGDPDFRAGGGFCNFVVRNPNNTLTVFTSYFNISSDQVRGLDFVGSYRLPLAGGTLNLSGQVTHFIERIEQTLPTDPIVNQAGTLYVPEMTGTFDASYTRDQWSFGYGVDWVGATDTDRYFGVPQPSTYTFAVPDYFVHSARVTFRTRDERMSITLGVRNLTDTDRPQISHAGYSRIGNTPLYSGYDLLGRSFYVNTRFTF